jgi:hypothetical protein
MNAKTVFSAILFVIGLIGFITTAVVGLATKFVIATVALMVFFFLAAIVGLLAIIQFKSEE